MSLLNKFRTPTKQKDPYQEIVEHIRDILNVNQGFDCVDRRMGLDSYDNLIKDSQIVQRISENIKRVIADFEPRIEVTGIESIQNASSFNLSFEIGCKIHEETRQFYLDFYSQQKIFRIKEPNESVK